ncbi:hypothetical protein RJ639_036466 [Escallonia herrerae]|uniref:60S ribosomal protein L27 n=1 Tax=Escallonia herrerae TaxID=1293975 RepID=A0AA89BDM5_9ASTE|nr:hypothetical protein RJ639_036466 [Escallonia herrerae]
MVKFLKVNKAVVMLNGRYAGRKGVIVRSFDDGTRDRPYGHCLVVGISKYPKKVIRKDSAKKTAKKSRVKAFIKLVNYNHIMPTRYTLDVDLKDVVTPDVLQSRDKKVTAAKEVKARFEERFKTGKNRWWFVLNSDMVSRTRSSEDADKEVAALHQARLLQALHDYTLDVNLKDVVISAREESEEQFRNSCFFGLH